MHDLDRALFETGEWESSESEQEDFLSILGSLLPEVPMEIYESEQESSAQELHEVELASELLGVSSEAELDRFLGDWVGRAGRAVGDFARSPVGQAAKVVLKDVARAALPSVGRAVGNWVSPGRGGDVGAAAGTLAGKVFGLELEGLSHEDREFEEARAFIRFAQEMLRQLLSAPPNTQPRAAVRTALVRSASTTAPGLLKQQPSGSVSAAASGTWTRKNGCIVLNGV
jgi:hypothetical protein